MKIFVTGFHRSGTHSAAEDLGRKHRLLVYREAENFGDIAKISIAALDGFVIHCPALAHKTIELAKMGSVFWCCRDKRLDVIAGMRELGFGVTTWDYMKGFRTEFPDDPIWDRLDYDGSEDTFYGFTRFMTLFCTVKDYFYQKYFKDACNEVLLESQPYFDGRVAKELIAVELIKVTEDMAIYESICQDKA